LKSRSDFVPQKTDKNLDLHQGGIFRGALISAHEKTVIQLLALVALGLQRGPTESFAEATLATEGGCPADARATEPTTVLLVPKHDFVDLLRRRPDLALRMLGSMSQHLRVIVGLLDDLTLKDMETRVANWLLKRCPCPIGNREVEIKLDRTKRVLAAEFGATSETLSRTLAKFRDRKLLRVKGNTLVVTRPAELQKLFREHLGEV
jgi:CRP-like cAMP-binding protein